MEKTLTVSEYCGKYNVQNCQCCERLECCDNLTETKKVFERLVKDMNTWGSWEDGIPDEFYDNWMKAKEILGL
jgi:hypothetical protein